MSSIAKAKSPDHVPFWKMAAWATRPISLGAVTIITMYLSMYCTDTLGMPPALVGTLLMASKVFDGVTDLFAGWLVDNTNSRWGKGRPYELSIIGVWVCMFALFSGSENWSMATKSIWIFVMYTLVFSVFSTLLNAAETTYSIRAFRTQMAVVKVASYSGILVTLGSMIISVSFPIFVGTMGTSTAGWRKLMAMYAIPLVVVGLVRFLFVKEVATEQSEAKDEKVEFKDILRLVTGNKYIWLLAIVFMVPTLVTSMAAGTYYFTWIVGDIKKFSAMQVIGIFGLVLILFFPTLMKKFSAMDIIGATAALAIAGYTLCFFAGKNLVVIAIGLLLSGLVTLPTSYMKSPLIMQIADYNAYQGQPRMVASMAAIANFMNKLGGAFGSFLLGVMLDVGGYNGTLTVQPDSALMMIRVIFGIIPSIFMVIVLICVVAYRPLDRFLQEKSKNKQAEAKA